MKKTHLARPLGLSAALAIVASAAVAPTAAQANPIARLVTARATSSPNSAPCPTSSLSQPFAAFGDWNEYELVPGGNFAHGTVAAGWTFAGGARGVSGSDPLGLIPSGSAGYAYLPAGASIQAPPVCVDSQEPTVRFMDAAAGGIPANVDVQFLYRMPSGQTQILSLGATPTRNSWEPSYPLLDGSTWAQFAGAQEMSVRITATAPAVIDDLFVDPRMTHG